MEFADRGRLLDPTPMALETGYERSPRGVLHVAIRTDMRGCTGAMLDWWFAARIGTREYRWWHPLDHIGSDWTGGGEDSVIGRTHLVTERFTGSPPEDLSIQFRDPAEFFDSAAIDRARKANFVSALFCVRGGAGHDARTTPDGAVIGTRLIHVARDTHWGVALRSHFFLGEDMAAADMPPAELKRLFPDGYAPGLLQHCYDEFSFLTGYLPALWRAEGAAVEQIQRPW